MESFTLRYRNALVLIAVLLAQTILLAVQVRSPEAPGQADGRRVLLIRSWAVAVVTPVERLSNAIGDGVRDGWSNYIALRHTRQQNKQLQDEIARLRLEESELAEDAIQGRRLESLLAFRKQYVTETVAAQVIGTSGVDQSRVLYIDKGWADGLRPDMAVITPDGIVGKVRDVFPKTSPHTAQVLEIDDPASGAGVILASTRIRAILRGGPDGRVQIGNLTADSRIKPGETVLTSGGDQIFPRGLKVGTIESIGADPDHQPYTLIRVKPAANLTQLEEVLIITGTQPDLPPVGQQDLAGADATAKSAAAAAAATEARRAADMAAERLPSLHDDDPPAVQGLPGAAPAPTPLTPAIPKAIPTVHSDRYTPGAAPPAESLTPGGTNPAPASVESSVTSAGPQANTQIRTTTGTVPTAARQSSNTTPPAKLPVRTAGPTSGPTAGSSTKRQASSQVPAHAPTQQGSSPATTTKEPQ